MKKNLGLEYRLPAIYWNKDLCEKPCDILGYVSAYLHYCGRRILTNTQDMEILSYVPMKIVINDTKKIFAQKDENQISVERES